MKPVARKAPQKQNLQDLINVQEPARDWEGQWASGDRTCSKKEIQKITNYHEGALAHLLTCNYRI